MTRTPEAGEAPQAAAMGAILSSLGAPEAVYLRRDRANGDRPSGHETGPAPGGPQPCAPPPPYKVAIVTWAAIFPLITLIAVASAPLIRPWPLVSRLAVTTLVTVPVMTWVVMPRVTWLLRRWLYPGRR